MTATTFTPARIPITVVIAARNEAANIAACVDAARWADEILVADHGSTDDTAALASDAGAVVLSHPEAPTIGALRNIAIAAARNAWVLIVDADERATSAMAAHVSAVLANPLHDAYRVPRRNFFLGREVRHGGWERDRPIRLIRASLRYDDSQVHERIAVATPLGTLDAALLHYPYGSLDEYFEKFARYSQWWAEDQWRRGRRTSVLAVLFKPPARFLSMYVFRLGFLDGARGLVLAALASASVLAKYARLWAMQCES
jgi:glycosyltransferase involved in cell wall biosynthesis